LEERAPSPDTLDGHCLAEEVIHALACGALEAAERSKALAHLDDCELCQALLADEVRGLPEFNSPDDVGSVSLIQVGALVGGRYRVQRFVARGGMGEVYEAWDLLLAERVALKTINPLAASSDQVRASARFKQEVQLSRRVADAHVCRIFEFGQHTVLGFGPIAYLTMEFIEGQTLGARLRKGPRLPLDEVMVLSRQVLRGLAAAHAVGVLHRDLKSENVMLRASATDSGSLHAVIMDFGLARVLGDQAHLLTERHELVGSAAYMAPEQLEDGAALSQSTDIYSFGVVLFEMLTGRLPFDGKSAVAMAMRRLTQKAPAPSSIVPELSAAWDDLVLRCLERDVDRRFSSTKEVSAALDAIAHSSAILPRRPRNRRGALLAGAALAAFVVALVYLLGRTQSQTAAVPSGVDEQKAELSLQPVARPDPTVPEAPAPPEAVDRTSPAVAAPLPPPAPPVSEAVAPAVVRKRAVERRPAAAQAAPNGPAAAAPAEAAPSSSAEDIRDVFFLDGPNERRPQNSNE
jgi:hypothetical protein